jgi:hypothetical protein
MKRTWFVLLFVALSVAIASAQRNGPLDVGGCASVVSKFGPNRCPTSSCGSYDTLQTVPCNEVNECDMLIPISVCCGKYPNNIQGDYCVIVEMKEPRVRSRILELALDNQILVPTCTGAYVPARIAFRKSKWRDDDGGL